MFKTLYRNTEALYNKKIDGTGLAIFRILYSLVLLGEVLLLFYFRHLIFDKIPFLIPGEIDMTPIFLFWMLSILFILVGLFTRTATIINWIATVTVVGTLHSFEYHMFYSYLVINFMLIFLPVSQCWSIDRLRKKLKYSTTRVTYEPSHSVTVLAYYIPVFIGIGFVYFDSIFFKYTSYLWMHGLGLWLPASMPQAMFLNTSFLLNSKFVALTLGYITLVFESVFLFLFWTKRFRVILLIIGIGLHLGILICFPLPCFALGVVGLYSLMVPVGFWKKLFSRNTQNKKYLTVYYDGECPFCNRAKIVLEFFDIKSRVQFTSVQSIGQSVPELKDVSNDELLTNIHAIDKNGKVYAGLNTYIRILSAIFYLKPLSWLLRLPLIKQLANKIYRYLAVNRYTERCTEESCGYAAPPIPADENQVKLLANFTLANARVFWILNGVLLAVLLQLVVTYNSPLIINFRKATKLDNNKIVRATAAAAEKIEDVSKVVFGITHHGVFMDAHFDGYNHTIAVVYKAKNGKEIWLPMTTKAGTPGSYLLGFNWVKWTFRVNSPLIIPSRLAGGVRDFSAFWAEKNGISLNDAIFEIRVKKNLEPRQWEYNFLNNQLKNPWLPAGNVTWKNGVFSANIVNIEAL